jgi:hypothetical protein
LFSFFFFLFFYLSRSRASLLPSFLSSTLSSLWRPSLWCPWLFVLLAFSFCCVLIFASVVLCLCLSLHL